MEPLAQLQDIHTPEQITHYPIAIGWWIIACVLIAIVVFVFIKYRKRQALRKSQQIALKQLALSKNSPTELITLLKWAALAYFPRNQVAHLYGDSLKQFMTSVLPEQHREEFIALSGDTFNLVYQKNVAVQSPESLSSTNSESFKAAVTLWLKKALPNHEKLTTTGEVK